MQFIQVSWRDGSNFNNGLTSEEYFYNQIYQAVQKNVANRTLPFFNSSESKIPVELSTGKIINDQNLIALEQVAAANGYKSNLWLYGSELEKLRNQGITINFQKDSVPVLCTTKFANATHLNSKELYINESGNKSPNQFMYNFDCLTEKSKQTIQKYYNQSLNIETAFLKESFGNYVKNIKNKNSPNLQKVKETVSLVNKDYDYSAVINAQAHHICHESTGLSKSTNQNTERKCYELLEKIFSEKKDAKVPDWKVGESLSKAMDAGTWYAKSFTSKDFIVENNKLIEENHQKQRNLRNNRSSEIEY